jgi:hypothetical protein
LAAACRNLLIDLKIRLVIAPYLTLHHGFQRLDDIHMLILFHLLTILSLLLGRAAVGSQRPFPVFLSALFTVGGGWKLTSFPPYTFTTFPVPLHELALIRIGSFASSARRFFPADSMGIHIRLCISFIEEEYGFLSSA